MLTTDSHPLDPNIAASAPVAFAKSTVHALHKLDLPQGVRLCQYANAHEQVYYQNEQIHTFSMYTQGGYQTRRTDTTATQGAPGRFCLMPAGSYSAWDIGEAQQFMHVYFDDSYIKRLALQNFDVDPRRVSLPHLTFESSAPLMALVQHSLLNWDWTDTDNQMLLQHSLETLMLNLLKTVGVQKINTDTPLKAGLSPSARSRVEDYVQANYQRQILLAELAEIAGLSEYHFARMFKISFAQPPQHYISRLRVEKLQQRLKALSERPNMAALAQEHGFSSQSHMGRVFKQYTGLTPGKFANPV